MLRLFKLLKLLRLLRVARLLQMLSPTADADLDTLKEVNTPVAKLYNWNLLLPKLRNGEQPTMQDLLDDLRDSPLAQLASHLWFVGQRLLDQSDTEIPPFQDATEALHLSIDQHRSDVRSMNWNAEPTQDATEVAARIEQLRGRGSKPTAIHRETGH